MKWLLRPRFNFIDTFVCSFSVALWALGEISYLTSLALTLVGVGVSTILEAYLVK